MKTWTPCLLAAACGLAMALPVPAQESVIKKALAERLPELAKVDEVSASAIPGLYEVRIGADIYYTDERGDHLIQGQMLETKSHTNLTQAKIDKINAIDFGSLPLQDAVVWKQGSGARKLVVFADPNCGYCKRLETDLQQVKDVTVYTFLIPILGGDSPEKARDIWCAKDHGAVWRNWMIHGAAPLHSTATCDTSALDRNLALSKKHRVNATPSMVFEDGRRVAGALPPERVEKQFASLSSPS